jgi:hypothetical protein
MSVQALSWVLDSSNSTYGARLVLLSIANHCDKFGTDAWPKIETIALESHLSVREVAYAIKDLISLGELTVEKGKGRKGKNLYSLTKLSAKFAGDDQFRPATNDTSTCKPCSPIKEEPSLTAQTLRPPSSDGKKKVDPRYKAFVEALSDGYKRRQWEFAWNGKDGTQLNALLKDHPQWDVKTFQKCVANYFKSDKIVPGGMPYLFLSRLPQYHAGPLNEFGKLKEATRSSVDINPVASSHADSIAHYSKRGQHYIFCNGDLCGACAEEKRRHPAAITPTQERQRVVAS